MLSVVLVIHSIWEDPNTVFEILFQATDPSSASFDDNSLSSNGKHVLQLISKFATLLFPCLSAYTKLFMSRTNSSISSVQSLNHVRLFVTPWTAVCQASLSITNSQSSPKLMSIESVMWSNHLILCHPLLLLPLIFPSIRVFSAEPTLHQVAKVLEFQL